MDSRYRQNSQSGAMTAAGWSLLKQQLRFDEGSRLESYTDPTGHLTIGVGHNIEAHGVRISEAIEDELLDEDMARVVTELDAALPWLRDLDEPRQRVLYNMAFNMGTKGLLKFVRTLRAIEQGNYDEAANYMGQSLWAAQVKGRAERLIDTMRTGIEV